MRDAGSGAQRRALGATSETAEAGLERLSDALRVLVSTEAQVEHGDPQVSPQS